MEDFTYQLVIQLPGSTQKDLEVLVNLETALMDAEDNTYEVDGHDFGSGTMNVFIHTNDPIAAFAVVQKIAKVKSHTDLKAAYRSFDEDEYKVIWPENADDEFNL